LTNLFTKEGLRFLLATFAVSFLLGGVVAIVGFCLVVDAIAGK
jgi:hypothetical protein